MTPEDPIVVALRQAIQLLDKRVVRERMPDPHDPSSVDLRPELADAIERVNCGADFFDDADVRQRAWDWVNQEIDEAGNAGHRGLGPFKRALGAVRKHYNAPLDSSPT